MHAIQEPQRSEVIEMALADDIPFSAIENRFGITEPRLKIHMKQWLKPASYRAWRKRVAHFRDQRTVYKA